ncbi:TonB-dependent receptor [Marinigracilibium pacificum]|uniref:TonB-dependent receptor n=1 Tax=Marinigracilibium pacificum TaxID=2729599 RepID=A0A848IZ64_9BACT|nr:TonB-dependent receptor [Marinigracilibium pacificum]NMM47289.1 TonB-dependent receptor [Marinigracilibium pacificum]
MIIKSKYCNNTALFLTFLSLFFYSYTLSGQSIKISGKVSDPSGEPLQGVNIYFQGTFKGTSSISNGSFELEADLPTPQVIIFSMIGYQTVSDTIDMPGTYSKNIILAEDNKFGNEIVISASRVEESILLSPVTIEKLEIRDLRLMPQANFYDGLYKLKGVDMNVQSITLRNINTRGFNGNTNFRFNQVIDGVNNQAPGLSFSAGNLLGLSPIDVESVELITGASSVVYGPGGLNGTLVMTSKDPFEYMGLSGSVQTGVMRLGQEDGINPSPYYDVNIRYSKVLSEKLAFKFAGNYLKAKDWIANDYRDKNNLNDPTKNRYNTTNYDGVNVYGDETAIDIGILAPDIADRAAQEQGTTPGTPEYDQIYNTILNAFTEDGPLKVTRSGWAEQDLVNYDAYNAKASLSAHYKFNKNTRAILQGGIAEGQAVYSAQNRFSINDFRLYNIKAEIKNRDYEVRYWWVKEDAGYTYDAGATAAFINEAWKPSEIWYQDYIQAYLIGKLGFGYDRSQANQYALSIADNRDINGTILRSEEPAKPLAGTPEFNTYKNQITDIPIGQGGSRVLDFSSLSQFEGIYNFSRLVKKFELLVGVQYRLFNIDSDGTVFYDTPGNPIRSYQYGGFIQFIDTYFNDRLRLNISSRYDKDENFKGRFTPRVSAVLSLGEDKNHNIRASAQSAFRFPAISDQWVDIRVGPILSIGGQDEILDKYGVFTNPTYPLNGSDPVTSQPDTTTVYDGKPPFRAETVLAYEIGYKGLFLQKSLMVDAEIFINEYDGFQGNLLVVQNPYTSEEQRYQTVISQDQKVVNWGWAVGVDWMLPHSFIFGGNLSYSTLGKNQEFQQGFQTRFNTPEYRYNVYLNKYRVWKKFGFGVNWHWQEAFQWESSFGIGEVPAYGSLDLQITYRLPKIRSAIKIGGSNVLNDYYVTSFGSSQIGGLYYVKFIYDQNL